MGMIPRNSSMVACVEEYVSLLLDISRSYVRMVLFLLVVGTSRRGFRLRTSSIITCWLFLPIASLCYLKIISFAPQRPVHEPTLEYRYA